MTYRRLAARTLPAALIFLTAPLAAQPAQESPPAAAPRAAADPPGPSHDQAVQPSISAETKPDARGSAADEARNAARLAAEAFENHDYDSAERLLRRQLELQPGSYVALYNLGCVRAALHDAAGATDLILRAIENGFDDLRQLRRDPALDPVRADPRMAKVMDAWPEILDARLEANLAGLNRLFPDSYNKVKDGELRLCYLSAFDPKTFEQARQEVQTVAQWGLRHVFTDLNDPEQARLDPWVIVVLPRQEHYLRWVLSTYGPDAVNSFRAIGGSYDHDVKRLVTQDVGATLRHEFLHVLHWRSMGRLGQSHAIWIQEGLCSLVEDFDRNNKGEITPVASWRTNIAKRLEKAGRLTPIEKLAALTQTQFVSSRPLANYAQARAFFLYLYERGKLADWYRVYGRSFREDPTGIKACEAVLGMPVADINKDYRAWLRNLPNVAEEIAPGKASLGVDVEPGDGDGPVVASLVRRRGNGPTLILGDTITAINGRPTRDIAELVRVLSDFNVGDKVTVSYRRGSKHGELEVTLAPAAP